MNLRLGLLLVLISAAATTGEAYAATRIALVGAGTGVENVLDAATALLSNDTDLQLLDRAEVGRVLREQEISLAGLVRAEHAVKAGQLLHADLFAVLEGALTNETKASSLFGLVVFNARNGVRYADSALVASNVVSAASATAEAIRAAVAKAHLNPQDLHTVGVLRVRNADLPRQLDSLCDTVGLLLERELTASPGIAVLERRRLEQVNKERSLPTDAEGNRLLGSLRMIELDIARDGEGLQGSLALVGADGARCSGLTASVPTSDPAALAHLLVDKTERFLKAPANIIPANRGAEAGRFHREYLLLLQHRDWVTAVHPLDAALALAPEQTVWQGEMALLLPFAAIEFIYPGGVYKSLPDPPPPSSEDLASCLALGWRAADLLLDLSREAADRARPGQPTPEVLKTIYRDRLCQLLQKLADVKTVEGSSAAEIAALTGKERTLRMEVIEPFLSKQSVDKASFAAYSSTLFHWLNFDSYRSGSLSDERLHDDKLALSHWVEVSHKLNPPDGSGDYAPFTILPISNPSRWNQVEEFRQKLEQDQDPVIRLYARASRVASLMKLNGYPTDSTLAAEREFRLYAQELLARSEAAKPGPLHDHAWRAIRATLSLLINHEECGKEYLEACHFAFAQEDIQVDLFYRAAEALERKRNLIQELEVVDGALKLILGKKPEAYPKTINSFQYQRSDVIKDLQQKRDYLVAELAGTNTKVPAPSPWKKKVCLLDLVTPINGFAWLFKPMVQDGQVFALALGFHEWGLPEDRLQLVRVPLQGGAPSFLGQANISGIEWVNRPVVIKLGPQARLKYETPTSYDVGRAACFGAGCYFAATCSGVFIFPTNGGPVLHLGTTNGLPSEDTHAVAFLDGKLYIGAGEIYRNGYLATYDPESRRVRVLASSRRSERISPFDDQPPFHTHGLVADPIRHRLLMAISTVVIPNGRIPDITPGMGIWSYLPSTGEYKRLAPLLLPTPPAAFLQLDSWTGLADTSTLAIKQAHTMALFDLRHDCLLSVSDSSISKTNAAVAFWRRPVPGFPGNFRLATGPFLLRNGWFYSARPFERMALADGRREKLPPLRTDYPFEPKECLELLDDGKHLLAADQYSLWLLELAPETARGSVGNGDNNSALTEP